MARTKRDQISEVVVESKIIYDEGSKLSIDLGNAYSNMVADGGFSSDWRSIIGRVSNSTRMYELPFDSTLKIDGELYVVGEEATTWASDNIEDFPTTDRYVSSWYRKLFLFSLHKAYGKRLNQGPFSPKIISSIPAKEFKVPKRVEQIKQNLVGNYCLETSKGSLLQVIVDPMNITIIPEGAGSFYSMVLAGNANGNSRYARGCWMVLDLGYLTGDIVMFENGEYISDKATSDPTIGVRKVAEAIATHIRSENGPDLDPSQFDEVIKCDSIVVSGDTFDIKEVREHTLELIGSQISRFVQKQATGKNIAGCILSGGGTELFAPYIKMTVPMVTAINPRRANVEGAFLILSEE